MALIGGREQGTGGRGRGRGRILSLGPHHGPDSLSCSAFNSSVVQLVPPPRPLARDSQELSSDLCVETPPCSTF